MIYFTNTKLDKLHMAFIGRWAPMHKGHEAIINTKRKENPDLPVLIMVRDRKGEKYSTSFRAEILKLWMKDKKIKGTIMIVPDIEGIYWGRKVGYKTQMVDVDKEIKKISGTEIRNGIKNGFKKWKDEVADKNSSHLLTPTTSKIAETGLVVWLTGCPCSGKTTIANGLVEKIKKLYPYLKIKRLDGDVIRGTPIAYGIGFSPEDRALHIRRMAQIAKMMADLGTLVVCSFVSPSRKIRKEAEKTIGKNRFIEVYVKASKKTRIERDKKGLYKKAMRGEIDNLTGYNAKYEEPKNSLVCDTDKERERVSINKIFKSIFRNEK